MNKSGYLEGLKKDYDLKKIVQSVGSLRNIKCLIIGDTILDKYTFVVPKGRAVKDPILSLDYVRDETYAGGILAVANHVSDFVDNIKLVSLLGDRNRNEEFVLTNLNKKIKTKLFTKKDSPTIVKERFVDNLRNTKIVKIEYINEKPLDKKTEANLVDYLTSELPKHDLVMVADYGHGFLSDNLVRIIEKNSKYLAANIQTNSSNMGFNCITRYKKIDYLTSNEGEIRLALHDRNSSFEQLILKLKKSTHFNNFLITTGATGVWYYKDKKSIHAPALTTNVRDIVGAGDAVFSITSLCSYKNFNPQLLTFLANCVGGVAIGIIGNKEGVTKEKLISFISNVYATNDEGCHE